MKVIAKVLDVFESTHAECARNIASGNICAGRAKMVIRSLPTAGSVDSAFIASDGTESTVAYESEFPFGEVISLKGITSDARVVTVHGQDYLGNDMVEEITLSGTTVVPGKKAFKKVLKATVTTAGTVELSTTNVIGVEYQTVGVDFAVVNGVKASTAPTFTAGTHTQTATSADPRGTVTLTSLTAGVEVELVLLVSEFCTKDNGGADVKGGLFGVKPHKG